MTKVCFVDDEQNIRRLVAYGLRMVDWHLMLLRQLILMCILLIG